jgi:phage FluMu protein Com
MSNGTDELRCTHCGRLLAKLKSGVLALQRGDVQATFDGDFHASFVCYQPRCGRLNVVRIRPSGPQGRVSEK